jgi:hypothetical protein
MKTKNEFLMVQLKKEYELKDPGFLVRALRRVSEKVYSIADDYQKSPELHEIRLFESGVVELRKKWDSPYLNVTIISSSIEKAEKVENELEKMIKNPLLS